MTDINKQKFLAELGKLLTFMYEEDRQDVLAMYNKMFDDSDNEQALLQLLSSPTRQAVIIARAYDSKVRKLQVHAQSREEDDAAPPDEIPSYVLAVHHIYRDAVEHGIIPQPQSGDEEEQVSPAEDEAEPEERVELPGQICLEDLGEESAAEEACEAETVSESEEPSSVEEAPIEEKTAEKLQMIAEEAPAEEAEHGEIEDDVDVFLKGFAIDDCALNPAAAEKMSAEEAVEAPSEQSAEELPAEESVDTAAEEATETESVDLAAEPEEVSDSDTELAQADTSPLEMLPAEAPDMEFVRKPKVFILILFILLAVPITAAGVVLLLVPTLLFLVLAAGVIAAGSAILIAAFSGFAVFADIMVVLGTAVIILALGLLLLWIFVWFIGGPIVGLIHKVTELGAKWCYKEVPAV